MYLKVGKLKLLCNLAQINSSGKKIESLEERLSVWVYVYTDTERMANQNW